MWTKIYNLYRQVAAKGQITNEGYIPYFDGEYDDNFTLRWANIISKSPSAVSCLSTLIDFMEGAGFSGGADLENKIINAKGETLFQLHQKTVKEYAQNKGFYWLLRYNAAGAVTEWEVLPFENCRLGKPDDTGYISKIHYNPFFGTPEYRTNDKRRTKIYDTFSPKAVKEQILEQGAKYKGQVYFFGTTSSISRFYPINEAFAASSWMKIEAGAADYHEDKIDNGFLNDYILVMKGDPNAPSTNPEYADDTEKMTVADEFDQVMEKNFMGRGKHANVMVQWVNNSDEKPEIVSIPTSANGDMFITLDNQATKKITVAWKVPGILANIQDGVSLGGDANQIRVAVKLMQQRVVKDQRHLTDSYDKILKIFYSPYLEEVDITPYNPYPELEILDDKIWNAMSVEERRQWIQDNTDIDFTEAVVVDPAQASSAPTSSFKNAIPIGFPDKVKNKVKKTLDYVDKMGLKCGGKAGRQVSEAILANTSMGYKQLKRIHSYLKAREQYSNSEYKEGCNVIEYNAWGGKEMFDFLEGKLKDLDSWLN